MASRSRAGAVRLKSFRLEDVPERVRLAALDKLLKTPGSADGMLLATVTFADRIALGVAATRPSSRVYWVSVEAYERAVRR